ncbi:MAG: phosphomannomutase/phosphoglucomutase [Kiritimatiellae bacterium]|nr:phosphomannomutase/phosphoglucomutase [Kiritimatiellia bacterium]
MSIYKAYDIRGVFGRDFDAETVHRIGRWLPEIVPARRALVGRDARASSPAICEALCRGLTEAGCDVDDMGLATTPMVYCFTARHGYDLSLQITASHNPACHNGLKVSRREALPVGYDTGLAELEQRVTTGRIPPPAVAPGHLRQVQLLDEFIAFLAPWRPDIGNLRLAIDCSDGMAALVARPLLGDAPRYLFDTPDGAFPHHPPNPLEEASRVALTAAVQSGNLDAGVIFDGDGDRVMFIDERGRFVRPDLMIAVIAARFLRKEPGAAVLQDIRTSRGVSEGLRAAGARPAMWKVGHAFAKLKMRELDAVCGGELAGHYYFRDFFYCDSGELAALIALGELASARRRGQTFSELLAPLARYANTGELNFPVGRKDEAMRAVCDALMREAPPDTVLDFDGYRIEYPEWWISIRKSNTEAYLRVIIEARDDTMLADRRDRVERLLRPYIER